MDTSLNVSNRDALFGPPGTRYGDTTTRYTLLGKVPVIRYVSCGCGYVENWVESPMELVQIHQTYGAP